MNSYWRYLFFLMILITVSLWISVFSYPNKNLKIIACDVGQGDSIFITLNQVQILVDGGPDNSVLGCLSDHMPFWDRNIEVVMLTHPQKDHFLGLIEVLQAYQVKNFVATTLNSGTSEYRVLINRVTGEGSRVINPNEGSTIRVGLIHIDIVWPLQEDFMVNSTVGNANAETPGVLGSSTSSKDTNEFSVVAILNYKKFNGLLTGDISPDVSNRLAGKISKVPKKTWEYIKIPHHGSKNGLTSELLNAIEPRLAVISVGRNNSYGHPHKEILDMLKEENVQVLRTDQVGDVVVETDGDKVWYKKK